jgi:hypothetical protein
MPGIAIDEDRSAERRRVMPVALDAVRPAARLIRRHRCRRTTTTTWHAPCFESPQKEVPAMIQGFINSRDVFLRGSVIVREFGISIWLRCCLVLLTHRRTTFLELVFAR